MYKVLSLAFLTVLVGCNQLFGQSEESSTPAEATNFAATKMTEKDVVAYIQNQDKMIQELKGKLAQCDGKLQQVRDVVRGRSKMDTKILTSNVMKLKFGGMLDSGKNLKLLYRASRDGWNGMDFHKRVDNRGATITIIKSNKGVYLGGYTDIPWKANPYKRIAYKKNSFIFNWSTKKNDFEVWKFTGSTSKMEVLHGQSQTIWFEYGIMMYANCNQANTSSYVWVKNFARPAGLSGQSAERYVNNGQSKVVCVDMETYQVV